MNFVKNHYYAARLRGNNGDLIVGRIKSVRNCGEIILVNLLNNKTSTKKASILSKRNKRITKPQAMELVALFKSTGDKQEVRKAAVGMSPYGQKQLPLGLEKTKHEKEFDQMQKDREPSKGGGFPKIPHEMTILGLDERIKNLSGAVKDLTYIAERHDKKLGDLEERNKDHEKWLSSIDAFLKRGIKVIRSILPRESERNYANVN